MRGGSGQTLGLEGECKLPGTPRPQEGLERGPETVKGTAGHKGCAFRVSTTPQLGLGEERI